MASNINPNNIDTTYPIAGQDNDSQGFRDNFTNIKTNFEYAETEIDDLQSKVLLKSALTGTTLDNDLNGALLENAKLQGTRYTKVDTATTTGNVAIDFSAGSFQKIGTLTGNASLQFSNIPSAGNYAEWTVELTQGVTRYTVTMPSAVSVGNTAIRGENNNVITYDRAGTYALKFRTSDGGSTIGVEDLYEPIDPLLLSSEDLASGAAISLTTGVSYIDTGAGAETATLAAGSEGQVKMLAMTADGGGNMVITVTDAAWGGSNLITFSTVGQGCTLLYTNSKWVCVGNNGAAFS